MGKVSKAKILLCRNYFTVPVTEIFFLASRKKSFVIVLLHSVSESQKSARDTVGLLEDVLRAELSCCCSNRVSVRDVPYYSQ